MPEPRFPSWAVPDPDDAGEPSPPPPSAGPSWSVAPTQDRAPLPVSSSPSPPAATHTSPPAAGRSAGAWPAVAAGTVVLLVLVLGAVVLANRPADSAVAGECFTYDGGTPRRVERVVPCDGPHGGKVIAEAADRVNCPEGTDAVLARAATGGGPGVLCVDEP